MKELNEKVADLTHAVEELQQGLHDIELDGGSQHDMERLIKQWDSDPRLGKQMSEQDETGTLELFWKEQMTRAADPVSKKKKKMESHRAQTHTHKHTF